MAADPDTDLLTIPEAARLLKVSAVTLHRWIKQGRLPAYHLGPRRVRLRRQDLAGLLVPIRLREVQGMGQRTPEQVTFAPPTEEEGERRQEAIRAAGALVAELRERQCGKLLSSSWRLIREAREDRSGRL